MGSKTKIEWTEATWNPIRGCSRVSEGCRNCYAERVAARFSGPGQPYEGLARMLPSGPRWTGEVVLVSEHLEDPLRWRRPRHVFVNSMSDLFHEDLDVRTIAMVWAIMAAARRHTFQVLTKRAERMHSILRGAEHGEFREKLEVAYAGLAERGLAPVDTVPSVLPNVWGLVSVEDQPSADERIPWLLETPLAVRGISAEPLLGPIDLETEWLTSKLGTYPFPTLPRRDRTTLIELLDWVIVGGESGPGARAMHPDWARMLRDQSMRAGVPFFFKQWGEWVPESEYSMVRVGKKAAGREIDGRTWDELPKTVVSAEPGSATGGLADVPCC